MARSEHQLSQHMTGSLFRGNRPSRTKQKEQPKTAETIIEYQGLLSDVLRNVTLFVDKRFPNADFLASMPGSHIQKDTPFSSILLSRYSNLTLMQQSKELTDNMIKTLRDFLAKVRYSNSSIYPQIVSTINVYQSLSTAKTSAHCLASEMERLLSVPLTPKTTDRQLKDQTYTDIIVPANDVVVRTQKSTQESDIEPPSTLQYSVNNLASFARLLTRTLFPSQKSASHAHNTLGRVQPLAASKESINFPTIN